MTDDCPYKAWIERSEELWRKREEMMTHRHEWKMVFIYGKPPYAGCLHEWAAAGCSAGLDVDEIERRLNATECLSAWAAEQFGWGQRLLFGPKQQGYKICDMLIAYSEALEESDE